MTSINNAALKARVNAVNRANEIAKALYPQLRELFSHEINSKVLRADGTLTKAITAKMPTEYKLINSTPRVQVYHDLQDKYSLRFVVKVCESIGDTGTCLYQSQTITIGSYLRGYAGAQCILESLSPVDNLDGLRTDYTVDEIEGKIADYKGKRALADEAQSALYPFSEYADR